MTRNEAAEELGLTRHTLGFTMRWVCDAQDEQQSRDLAALMQRYVRE